MIDGQQQDAEKEQDAGAPVEQHPADVEQKDDGDEAGAERDEKGDRLLPAGDYHDSSLCPQGATLERSSAYSGGFALGELAVRRLAT